jgi:phosphonate transport system substrate-binding protein
MHDEHEMKRASRVALCDSHFPKTLLFAIFLVTAVFAHQASAQNTLTFGVVPQQAASNLARAWTPILKYVSEQTGVRIEFRTAKNIPVFEERLAEGKYDLAYMNPYHYTVFSQKPGYVAFAKQAGKRLRGIVVVRADSRIQSIEGVGGKTIAFPAPAAFAASVLPRAYLNNHQIPFSPQYVSSHDSVYRSVAKNLFDVGGGIERTFNNVDPKIRSQLKVLWRTKDYTPHAFAAHPKLDERTRFEIANAMIGMAATDAGKTLLARIGFKGISPAADKDWDDIREMGITLLQSLITGK